MKNKKWQSLVKMAVVISLVTLVVGLACAPAAPAPEVSKEKVVRVGAHMVWSGAASMSCLPMGEMILDYFDYVNDELGGIEYVDPSTGKTEMVKLDVIWGDAAYNAARTLTLYKRQQAAGAQAMIIAGGSMIYTVSTLAIQDKMPCFGYSACFDPGFIKVEPKYWVVSAPGLHEHAATDLQWILENWTEPRQLRVALLLGEIPTSRASFPPGEFEAYADSVGVDLVAVEWTPLAASDLSVEITRMMEGKPDWVISMGGCTTSTMVFLKDAERLGFRDQFNYITYYGGGVDETMITVGGDVVEGMYGSIFTAVTDEDVPGVRLMREVRQKYRGKELTIQSLTGGIGAVGMAEGIRLAMNKVGYENLTGDAILEGFHSINNFDTGGLTPPITIDPRYPVENRHFKMARVEGGKWRKASDWIPAPGVFEP